MQNLLPMASYANLRFIHITCAVVSVSLFVVRATLQFQGHNWRTQIWLRVIPHFNDTVLLGAAVTLAMVSGQYPLEQNWLSAKVIALVVYIVLGWVALRSTVSLAARKVAFVAALISVGYLICVAHTRSPLLWIG